jgi:hypothetical protein
MLINFVGYRIMYAAEFETNIKGTIGRNNRGQTTFNKEQRNNSE